MIEMRVLTAEERAFVQAQRVAHLSTSSAEGVPAVVPVCFVYHDDCFYSPLDEKPKSVDVMNLRRVRNIADNPKVALVVDRYTEDWEELGYLTVRGAASLVVPGEAEHLAAVAALRQKYSQYRTMSIHERPLIRIVPAKASRWGTLLPEERRSLDLPALMRGRRSVRQYTPQPVLPEHVEAILEAGRWAPSPHGRQPWRFVVLTREERKRRLADAMAEGWTRHLEMDNQSSEIIVIRLSKGRQRLIDAPVAVILCLYLADLDRYPDAARQEAEATMAIQSLGAAAQNMLLTAHSLGLDGGWMCAPLFCPAVVCEALGLNPDLIPHALLTFGYAAADPKRRDRLTVEELTELYD